MTTAFWILMLYAGIGTLVGASEKFFGEWSRWKAVAIGTIWPLFLFYCLMYALGGEDIEETYY